MLTVTARTRPHHPWVFSNEILDPPVVKLPSGGVVTVVDPHGRFRGRGYANPHSLIAVRMYCGQEEDPDDPALYVQRLTRARDWRARVLPGRTGLRVCAGEADGLPGVIVDRYGDVLSVQLTTLGMDQRKDLVLAALREVFAPRGVVAKNDVGLRALEGLPLESGVWWGDVPARVPFEENGVRYEADLVGGQKTGFFFDQADNRAYWATFARNTRVLDVYAHLGGWALTALRHGATEAVAIDASAAACAGLRRNAELNGVQVDVKEGDAREELAKLGSASFDLVAVDPPAFAKNRKAASAALAGYKAVNAAAARLVRPGGLLFASSCSHHVEAERFEEAVVAGIRQAGRRALLLRRAGAAVDHPVLPGMPETEYLKHRVFLVQ